MGTEQKNNVKQWSYNYLFDLRLDTKNPVTTKYARKIKKQYPNVETS